MISRVREALAGGFFDDTRDGVARLGREVGSFETRGLEGTGVAGCALCVGGGNDAVKLEDSIGVPASGGSEDGGSEPTPGLSGVRNGDLNGFRSVFVASFSRRRLTFGVDILASSVALSAFR